MKTLLLLLVAVSASAQTAPTGEMTLGGIPALISQKISEAKPCGLVDLRGNIGGGAYLPIWTFHDMNGRSYVEAMNVGYRAIQGSKPSMLLMPAAFNATGISYRIWNFPWASNHLTRSVFPDMFFGPTVLLPLDSAQIKALKIKDPFPWVAFVGSVRFK